MTDLRDGQGSDAAADDRPVSCRAAKRRSCRSSSIAGRALVAVVAIMTFLASLTTGAVMLVRVGRRRLAVGRGARDHDPGAADARTATSRPRWRAPSSSHGRSAGVGDVRPYSKEDSARLLEPWLGAGLSLDELPVPRMIVVRLARGHGRPRSSADRTRKPRQRRQPRRSSRLDRPHAHHGANCRRRRRRHSAADAGGDCAVGDLRNARRDGHQPADRRGAAFHRRQGRLHRRPVPAPFSRARARRRHASAAVLRS